MSDEPDLASCPFCPSGGNPTRTFVGDWSTWVKCQECGATSAKFSTGVAAIAAWNRRASVKPGQRLGNGLVAVPEVITKAMHEAWRDGGGAHAQTAPVPHWPIEAKDGFDGFDVLVCQCAWTAMLAAAEEDEG